MDNCIGSINPVTGRYEEVKANPMESMTDEQKEYEAMQLVNKLDKLQRLDRNFFTFSVTCITILSARLFDWLIDWLIDDLFGQKSDIRNGHAGPRTLTHAQNRLGESSKR